MQCYLHVHNKLMGCCHLTTIEMYVHKNFELQVSEFLVDSHRVEISLIYIYIYRLNIVDQKHSPYVTYLLLYMCTPYFYTYTMFSNSLCIVHLANTNLTNDNDRYLPVF